MSNKILVGTKTNTFIEPNEQSSRANPHEIWCLMMFPIFLDRDLNFRKGHLQGAGGLLIHHGVSTVKLLRQEMNLLQEKNNMVSYLQQTHCFVSQNGLNHLDLLLTFVHWFILILVWWCKSSHWFSCYLNFSPILFFSWLLTLSSPLIHSFSSGFEGKALVSGFDAIPFFVPNSFV